jgi:hypothetical protein
MKIHVVTDDLLFASRLEAELTTAGHQITISPTPQDADLLILDLTADAQARLASLPTHRPPTLAFYSHVEQDVKAQADQAGITLTVPRSRMAREAPALVSRFTAS